MAEPVKSVWDRFVARLADAVGLLAAGVAVGAGAVGWWWLAATVGVAVVVAGLVALRQLSSLRTWTMAALCVVVGAGAVGATVVHEVDDEPNAGLANPPTTRSGPAASEPDPLDLAIDELADSVPYCIDVSGHGAVPEGNVVLVFDRPVVLNSDGEEVEEGPYFFNKPARSRPGGWIARNVAVGGKEDVGAVKRFHAVLVTQDTADFVFSVDGGPEGWQSAELPPHLAEDHTLAHRTNDPNPPDCGS